MAPTELTTSSLLRRAADLLDEHPDLPAPVITAWSSGTLEVGWQLMNGDRADDQKAAVRQIVRAIGGKWDKTDHGAGSDMYFKRKLDGLNLTIYATREQICERVVVGEETVTIPAKPAEPERTEVRETVEWRCAPVLAEVSA